MIPLPSNDLDFRVRGEVVGRGRRVSRVRISPIQTGPLEYGTTSNDTERHDAVGY